MRCLGNDLPKVTGGRRCGSATCSMGSVYAAWRRPARRAYRGGARWHGAHLRDKTFRLAEAKACDQPMSNPVFYPRHIEHRLAEALEDSPVGC